MTSSSRPDMNDETPEAFGSPYLDWKGWGAENFAVLPAKTKAYFDAELRRSILNTGKISRVLEIGFGNGAFLTYARERKWNIAGTELNPHLISAATAMGFSAHGGEDLKPFGDGNFDFVVAFDVLEHIPSDAMLPFLAEIKRVLVPGGMFMARFPNGDSPFGLRSQNGDVTHITFIGEGKAHYFAKMIGAEVLYFGGEAQPIRSGDIKSTLVRAVLVPLRKLINLLINAIFFPGAHVAFCSANAIMILKVP